MRFILAVAACGVLLALPPAGVAQEDRGPAAKCDVAVQPPPPLAGWNSKADITAATKEDGLSVATLSIDQAAAVTLHGTREVSYVMQPDKPGGSVAHGGLLAVVIDKAGTYQVSLSSGAWIDLVRDGKSIISSAHAPGPACTGIRKTVQFPLTPGRYVLQISANADPTIAVMVSRVS
jgi:hypothetical protein